MPDLSTPNKARDHARSMAGTVIPNMPIIPPPADLIWDETLGAGEYCARVLSRGTRLKFTNLGGDGNINLLVLNADMPIERLNVADTVKVQWNAYLGKGKLLLSDMGRVLMSIIDDTCENHDTFCGASNEKTNAHKFGIGTHYSPYPNACDRFLIALQKFGLGKKDIPPTINLFKAVNVELDGGLRFIEASSKPGDVVELRAEMNVIVVAVNAPHVLDPRTTYTCSPVRVTARRGPVAAPDDAVRASTPEATRAFQNTEDYFAR